MTELTLLVNSTDSALPNGSVAASIAGSGAVAGGFATVLSKRLMSSESIAAKEPSASTSMDEAHRVAVTEIGEAQPMNGKLLPHPAPQDIAPKSETGNPVLDASLLSAIAQGASAVNGGTANLPLSNTVVPVLGFAQAGHQGAQKSTLSQLAMERPVIENSTASTVVKTALSPQTTTIHPQNMPALPNTTQATQPVSMLPVGPAMLGKPVSVAAQQALLRASLNVGKADSLRADMTSAASPAVVNAQYNSGLSSTLTRTNHLMGNTMRMDMFASAMEAATQADASAKLTTPAASAAPVSLTVASAVLSDDTNNLLTSMPRIPGATVNGVSPMLTVSTPVTQPSWASELGQRVTWLANSELREAQLQLNPRSLGAVDVRIVYGSDQQLSVSFVATNPAARDALDAALPRLREMFEQQGLNLANANISHESPTGGGQRNSMNDEQLTPFNEHPTDDEIVDAVSLHSSSSRWLSEGMLDAYA